MPRLSEEYPYLDTPVGRLVVNICRDIRSDVPMVLNRAIEASIVVVPAYSRRLEFVRGEAPVLGQRQRAITVAVNPVVADFARDLGYIYAPICGEKWASGLTHSSADVKLPPSASMAILVYELGLAPDGRGRLDGPERDFV